MLYLVQNNTSRTPKTVQSYTQLIVESSSQCTSHSEMLYPACPTLQDIISHTSTLHPALDTLLNITLNSISKNYDITKIPQPTLKQVSDTVINISLYQACDQAHTIRGICCYYLYMETEWKIIAINKFVPVQMGHRISCVSVSCTDITEYDIILGLIS